VISPATVGSKRLWWGLGAPQPLNGAKRSETESSNSSESNGQWAACYRDLFKEPLKFYDNKFPVALRFSPLSLRLVHWLWPRIIIWYAGYYTGLELSFCTLDACSREPFNNASADRVIAIAYLRRLMAREFGYISLVRSASGFLWDADVLCWAICECRVGLWCVMVWKR